MDSEQRPHNRSTTSTTTAGGCADLLICFTSSMKISSKSILSPGRSREPTPISLSSSLSRRLRTNGSMKGGQASPMFPTAGKKKGVAFENPEPSSPKVTCIGQVRVKTKKQGKKMRSRSKRRGEVSFRRVEQSAATPCDGVVGQISRSYSQSHFNQQQEVLSQRNQRWVHLPMTICEALRAFGSDFNCFLPCRSSCMSSGEKQSKPIGENGGHDSGSSCGAVFARWLVALQDGDGKEREIELVVGEEEANSPEYGRNRSQRRHVFEDMDIGLERFEEEEETEEATRISICVPPKNALLLMRCRSDPVKMAALANRFWESPQRKQEEDETNEYQKAQEEAVTIQLETEHSEDEKPGEEKLLLEDETVQVKQQAEIPEEESEDLVTEEHKISEIENQEIEVSAAIEDSNREEQEPEAVVVSEEQELAPEETVLRDSSPVEEPTSIEEQEIEEIAENLASEEEEDDDIEENRASIPSSPFTSVHSEPEAETELEENESNPESENGEELDEENPETEPQASAVMAEPEESREEEEEEAVALERPVPEDSNPTQEYEPGRRSNDSVSSQKLPDCLLLMMCEPKLSMEVSKETWVCSTDFIRRLPDRPPRTNEKVSKSNAPDDPPKRTSTDSIPAPPHRIKPSRRSPNPLYQPPRSSCYIPAQYEPLVLKRCKSEPMRTASKLAPDACFWNNRKLEPHRPGIGATGVGC